MYTLEVIKGESGLSKKGLAMPKINVVAIGFNVTTVNSIFKVAAEQVERALGQSVKISHLKNTCFHARYNAILISPKLVDVGLPTELPARVVDLEGCKNTEAKLKAVHQALRDVCDEYLSKSLLRF